MIIIPATHQFLTSVCLVDVKTNSFFYSEKIDRVIVTQVGFCVISRWPLTGFLSKPQIGTPAIVTPFT